MLIIFIAIEHILIGCVFAMQVWFQLLNKVGLSALAPQAADTSFEDWWIKVDKLVPKIFKKGINSLIVLGAWMIWKQRNNCASNRAMPNMQRILTHIEEEAHLWCLAGARELAWLPVANG
jgi:nuclear pore complex protein Nup210